MANARQQQIERFEGVVRTGDQTGSRPARRLRRQGQIPAVIYGGGVDSVAFALSQDGVETALRRHASVIEIQLGDKTEHGLIKAVQYDHLGRDVLHLDLYRVRLDERVHYTVQVETRGTPKAVASGNGVLDMIMRELEVECVATAIPESIRVQVSALEVNDSIRVSDLEFPEGVTVLTDANQIVVSVRPPVEEAEEEEDEAAGPAEPEVIGRAQETDEKG